MPYPGDGYACTKDPGRIHEKSGLYPGTVLRPQRAAPRRSGTGIDEVKTLFLNYESVFNRSAAGQWGDLQSIGNEILNKGPVPDQTDQIVWDVAEALGEFASAVTVFGPAGPIFAFESLVAAYQLTEGLTSGNGSPVGDEIRAEVANLAAKVETRMFDAANTLDRMRDVIVSDFARLSTLGPVADGPAVCRRHRKDGEQPPRRGQRRLQLCAGADRLRRLLPVSDLVQRTADHRQLLLRRPRLPLPRGARERPDAVGGALPAAERLPGPDPNRGRWSGRDSY